MEKEHRGSMYYVCNFVQVYDYFEIKSFKKPCEIITIFNNDTSCSPFKILFIMLNKLPYIHKIIRGFRKRNLQCRKVFSINMQIMHLKRQQEKSDHNYSLGNILF